jgi:CRISPR system Cascade subunit CasE
VNPVTYLSRVRINPLRAASRQLLANPRAMHGAVMGGIPGAPDGERVLWRLDADDPRRPYLFVVTRTRPDWTHIVEQAGWPDAEGEHAAIRDYRPLLERIAVGREFAFRLTASPVQNTSAPVAPTPAQSARMRDARTGGGKTRGFRLAHRTAAAQLAWFLDRTDSWGFSVPASRTDKPAPGLETEEPVTGPSRHDADPAREIRITARNRHSFNKSGKAAPVTFHSATFEGRLQVTDTAAFTRRLLEGIGPSKAYGCGLLTLAPLPGQEG